MDQMDKEMKSDLPADHKKRYLTLKLSHSRNSIYMVPVLAYFVIFGKVVGVIEAAAAVVVEAVNSFTIELYSE